MNRRFPAAAIALLSVTLTVLAPDGFPLGRRAPADFDTLREIMVRDQIAGRGVRDEGVLRAMRSTPRHLFVPEERAALAYEDRALPVGEGQTISQPYVVALMTELLQPDGTGSVLEIGTGTGYQAAVLSPLFRNVYTIEIIPSLGKTAAERLSRLGYRNVEVRVGDGRLGWPERAPFDAIVVTAAAASIPPPLLEQLKRGGRLVAPVGDPGTVQRLAVIEKAADGTLHTRSLMPVRFVPLTGGEKE